MSETPLLALPIMEAAQAQKHVTHNEALLVLDAVVQLSVISRGLSNPPASPQDADRYLVATAPTGAWAGKAGQLAVRQSGAWTFALPREGWRMWVEDEDLFLVYDGSDWVNLQAGSLSGEVDMLGINSTANASNRLSVSSPGVLFNHDGSDQRLAINKSAAADTASLLFQQGFSGRAEMGLAGDNDFHLKVSTNGSSWVEALVIDRSTGAVSLPATPPADSYATRSALVAAVAGGLTRPDGAISHADGLAYRWKTGATSIPGLPGLEPAGELSVSHYGALADGTTDATAAIQAAIDAASAAGGGVVRFPAGIFAVASVIRLKSHVVLSGIPRSTVIRPTAGFNVTGNVIRNDNAFSFSSYTTRTDSDLGIENITFDGSLRPYVMYPTGGYTNQGAMILFSRCDRPYVRNCVFRDYRAGWGINSQGNRAASFQDNEFLRMGKGDIDTGGILNISYGPNVRNNIVGISRANPCVITFSAPHGFGTGMKYLRNVRGMTQLSDGEYNVTAATSTTVTLGAVNSSSYANFTFDPETEMTDRYALRSEGTTISGNRFVDLYRIAISDSGDGTKITGNSVDGAGEAGVYLLYAKNCVVSGNTIRGVTMTDIVASAIEINYGVNHIVTSNQLARCEGNAIRVSGAVGGRIAGNACKESGLTAGLNYPNGPVATAQGINGSAVSAEIRALILLTNYDDYPVDTLEISDNDLMDSRNGASRLTEFGIRINKRTVSFNNRGLRISGNRFRYLTGLAETAWISFNTATSANGCWVDYQHPTTGNRIVIESSGAGASGIASTNLASLPAGFAGAIAYAANGEKNADASGSGSGAMMFHDGSAWRYFDRGARWGEISGTLSAQSDLQSALAGKAAASHSHTASQVSDFAEAVDDRLNAALVAGANMTLVYDDVANTLTLASSGGSGFSAGPYRRFRTMERTR